MKLVNNRTLSHRVYLIVQAAQPVRASEIRAVLRATERQVEVALRTLRKGGWVTYERGPHRINDGHWSCVANDMPYIGGELLMRGMTRVVMEAKLAAPL